MINEGLYLNKSRINIKTRFLLTFFKEVSVVEHENAVNLLELQIWVWELLKTNGKLICVIKQTMNYKGGHS